MSRLTLVASLLIVAACGESGEPAISNFAGPGDEKAAGVYRLQGVPNVASSLLLSPEGRFDYYLTAGARDMRAAGRWTSDGRVVTLDTEPEPVPPAFSAGPVTRSEEALLTVTVSDPAGIGVAGVKLRLGFAGGRVVEARTEGYGWHAESGANPAALRWIELSLPLYNVPPRRFEVDPGAGNSFAFTLTPNDMAIANFRDQAFEITRRGLVRRGDGTSGVYVRQQIEQRGERK